MGRGRGAPEGGLAAAEIVTPPKKDPSCMEDADSAPKANRPSKTKQPAPGAPEFPASTLSSKGKAERPKVNQAAAPTTPKKPSKAHSKEKGNKKPKEAVAIPKEGAIDEGFKEKAFARRWRPQGERAGGEWMALRDVYDAHVRPHITKCPGKKED